MAASLISLGAMITLVGPDGIREMPIEDFFELDGMKKNVLQKGEFVCKVTFSEDVSKRVGAYKNSALEKLGISQRQVQPHHGFQGI